jgi:hypothetical protein
MVEIYSKIAERLPRFYRAWDYKSNMASIITANGKVLNEETKDLFGIMRSHWIDSAFSDSLDLLGSIFRIKRRKNESDDSFRTRIKYFIVEFMGGGTREAILAQTRLFLGSREGFSEVSLIENPPIQMSVEKAIENGQTWFMKSNSINDENFSFEFKVEEGKNELVNPRISDIENNTSITFNGSIKSGQVLLLDKDGNAKLDGTDVTEKVTNTGLKILRKGSSWNFSESTSPNIGKFDEGIFDRHVFETAIPTGSIRIAWTALLLSAFELKVLKSLFDRSGVTGEELQTMVGRIKAAGVKSIITISDSLDENNIMSIENGAS